MSPKAMIERTSFYNNSTEEGRVAGMHVRCETSAPATKQTFKTDLRGPGIIPIHAVRLGFYVQS